MADKSLEIQTEDDPGGGHCQATLNDGYTADRIDRGHRVATIQFPARFRDEFIADLFDSLSVLLHRGMVKPKQAYFVERINIRQRA